jgi:hypothetical protein
MPKQQLVDINQPLFSVWQGLYQSLYSKLYYEDVILRWKGPGLRYMGILMLLLTLGLMVQVKAKLYDQYLALFAQPLQNMPVLHLINGQMVTFGKQPYRWMNDKRETQVYIDTAHDLNIEPFNRYPNLLIYVSKHHIALLKPKLDSTQSVLSRTESSVQNDYYIFDFSGLVFDEFNAQHWLKKMQDWHVDVITMVMIGVFLWFFLWACLAVFLLSGAALGKFYAKFILRVDLSYIQSCRVMTVCLTPVIYLSLIWLLFQMELIKGLGLYLLLGYFSVMVFLYGRDHRQIARR